MVATTGSKMIDAKTIANSTVERLILVARKGRRDV
jgi:hypothetical protein